MIVLSTVTIPTNELIVREGFNPRSTIEVEELQRLANSIKARGLLQPVVVRETAEGFVLIDGHRRHAACQLAGVEQIDGVVRESESDLSDALVANIQRADLTPVEEAKAFERLQADHGWSQHGIADELGIAKKRVSERLALLKLPESVQAHIHADKLGLGCVKELTAIAKVSEPVAVAVADAIAGDELRQRTFRAEPIRVLQDLKPSAKLPAYTTSRWYRLPDFDLSEEAQAIFEAIDEESVSITEAFLDQAEAVGVAYAVNRNDWRIEGAILDHAYMSQLVSDALIAQEKKQAEFEAAEAKHHEERQAQAEKAAKAAGVEVPEGESLTEKQLENRQREAEQKAARAHNEALGAALLQMPSLKLDMETVRMFVYLAVGEQLHGLCRRGLRYVHPTARTIELKGKEGSQREKVSYLDEAELTEFARAFLDAARSPRELLTRATQVLLAAEYADERAVARSKRGGEGVPHFGYSPIKEGADAVAFLTELADEHLPAEQLKAVRDSRGRYDDYVGAHSADDVDVADDVDDPVVADSQEANTDD